VDKSGPIGEKDSRQEKSVKRMDQTKQAARQDALKDKDVISMCVRLWGVPWQPLGFSSVFYWGRRFPLPMPHNGLQKNLLWCPYQYSSNIRKSKGTKLLVQYPETLSGETTACFFAAQKFNPPHPPRGVRSPSPGAALHSGERVKHSETIVESHESRNGVKAN